MKLFTLRRDSPSFLRTTIRQRTPRTRPIPLHFPAYKNLSFSVGTLDSFLNDPPVSLPPTKTNSFQFTMGLTYAIKSKY